MALIRILSDSVATSDYKELNDLGVDVIPLSVSYDGKNCLDTELNFKLFNEHLSSRADNLPTTSQPSIASYEQYFEDAAKKGDSVVGVFMSNVLSSSFEGAMMAAKNVKNTFKDLQVRIVDSFAACGPQMASILNAVTTRDNGGTIDDVAEAACSTVMRSRIMFTPSDLRFLVLGGRLSSISAKVASKLKIFPIITTIDGAATSLAKIRTKQKADEKMFEVFADDAKEHGLKYVVVHYAGEKTKELKNFTKKVSEFVGEKVKTVSVSPVISVHSGPAIGIAYECERKISGKFSGEIPQIVYAI